MLRVASLFAVLSCAFAWTPAGLSLRIDGGRPLISSYGGLRASSAAVMKSKDERRAEEIAAAKKELAEAIAAKAAAQAEKDALLKELKGVAPRPPPPPSRGAAGRVRRWRGAAARPPRSRPEFLN